LHSAGRLGLQQNLPAETYFPDKSGLELLPKIHPEPSLPQFLLKLRTL